jgi:nucleotide-binding universal stress UspA family protein
MNHEATATLQAPVEVRVCTLVVPLDGSPEATTALPVARALAAVEGAILHFVHVSGQALPARAMVEHLGLTPEQLDGTVLDQRIGQPATEIVDLARGLGSRLIVMSSRCVQEAGRGALGSVTREVLRRAPCPIVIVPPERAVPSWSLRQILLPHDGIPTTAAAIARTSDLAEKARAELAVLHIASTSAPPPGEPGALMAPRYLDQPQHEWPVWAREFMDRIVALGGPPPAVRMRLFFACGEPADVIVEFAAEHHTDLVVIAWVAGWEPEQRTTMRKVIDQAPGPLLIFPLEEPQAGMMF